MAIQNTKIDPNAGLAPGVTGTYNPATKGVTFHTPDTAPVAGTPITSSSIQQSPAINLGGTIPPPTTPEVLSSLPVASTDTQIQTTNNDFTNKLMEGLGLTAGKATDLLNVQNEAQVQATAQKKKELSDLYNTRSAEYNKSISDAELNAGRTGQTFNQFLGTQGAINRAKASDLESINAQYQRASGNYDDAVKSEERRVNLKYAGQEEKNTILANQLAAIKDNVTKADKKQYDAQVLLNNKAILDTADNKELAKEIAKNTIGKGADVVSKAIEDLNKAKTYEEKLKIAAPYMATSNNSFERVKNSDGSESLMLVDKTTGKIIKTISGGGGSAPMSDTPLIRTITTPNGKKIAVDGYTLLKGDDPYFIAQRFGTDMQSLKDLNPGIKDWTTLQPGQVINIPNKTMSGSLLAATGLSQLALEYLKQGTTALTRLDKGTRQKIFDEVANYTKNKGIDEATFRQQYAAIGKTVEANVLRNNQSVVAESELSSTVQNLRDAATAANLKSLKGLNIAKIFAGTQLNTPETETFKFHLEQLRTEFAMYNAALSGQIDANGNIRQIDDADKKRAEELIQNGFAADSIEGFEKALKASTGKMRVVLDNSINAQNKQVWNLFGVGDQYQAKTAPVDPMVNIQNYGNAHPESQTILNKMKLDGITIEEINNWVNQQVQTI